MSNIALATRTNVTPLSVRAIGEIGFPIGELFLGGMTKERLLEETKGPGRFLDSSAESLMNHVEFTTESHRRRVATITLTPKNFGSQVPVMPMLELFSSQRLIHWSKLRLKDRIAFLLPFEAGPQCFLQHDLPEGHTLSVATQSITCADGCPRIFSIVRRFKRPPPHNVPPLILTTDRAYPENRFGLIQNILFGLRPRTAAD